MLQQLRTFTSKSIIQKTLTSCITTYPILNRMFHYNYSLCNYSSKQTKIEHTTKKASSQEIFNFLKPYYSNPTSKHILLYSFILTCISKGLSTSGLNSLISSSSSLSSINNVLPISKYFCFTYFSKFFGTVINEYRNIHLSKLTSHINILFSKETISYLNQIPYSEFKENSANILNSLNKTKRRLERINRLLIGNIMSNIIEASFVSLSLYKFLGTKYLITTLSAYYLYLLYSQKMSKIRLAHFKERLHYEIKAENKFYDIVNNIQTVKYFQGECKENSNYSQTIKEVTLKDEKVSKSLAQLNSGQTFILNSFILLNMLTAITDIRKGKITTGDIFMMQGLFNQLMAPLHIMGFLMRELDESRTQLQYGINIKKQQSLLSNNNYKQPNIIYKKGIITFNNVSFNYNPKTRVLNNINAIFEPGKLNCIVGESGQGKTTMFDLLYKLFSPLSGQILIDGQDINKCNDKSVRDLLTICPQNGNLFNESIQYNMMYGYNETKMKGVDKMMKMLKKLNLYRKMKQMPNGLECNVGSLGGKLSGGEKQRMLFIRALMKSKAKILLLDEPTSNLDNKNEEIVNEIIKSKLNKNMTLIITAHKVSTMKNADKIFVLDKGTIVETGTHKELIQKKGVYYKMITKTKLSRNSSSVYKH